MAPNDFPVEAPRPIVTAAHNDSLSRPCRRRSVVAIWCAIVLLAAAGVSFVTLRRVQPRVRNGLTVDPRYLDFGDVWATERFTWDFPIVNRSPEAISINSFFASCNCTDVSPKQLRLPSGGVAQLSLAIDLPRSPTKGKSSHRVSISIVPLVGDLTPLGDGWTIEGNVKYPVIGLPEFVETSMETVGETTTVEPARVDVTLAPEVATLLPEVEPNIIGVALTPRSANRLTINFEPSKLPTVGAYSIPVLLVPVLSTGKQLSPQRVLVIGTAAADVRLYPDTIAFGALRLGETRVVRITLSPRSGVAFSVNSVTGTTSALTVLEADRNRGELTREFIVQQRATDEGKQSTLLTLVVQMAAAETAFALTVPVSYYGTP